MQDPTIVAAAEQARKQRWAWATPLHYEDTTRLLQQSERAWREERDQQQHEFEMHLRNQAEEHTRAVEDRQRQREHEAQAKEWKGEMTRNCTYQKQRAAASRRIYAHNVPSSALFTSNTSSKLGIGIALGNGPMHMGYAYKRIGSDG